MAIQNPKDVFVKLLSDVRRREERSSEILEEISDLCENAAVKEALESRIFLKGQILNTLDRCFALIGREPIPSDTRLQDLFLEHFRQELAEIKMPAARNLYILAKAKHLIHLHVGEYVALTAMADITNHYGVGVMLEACLAENLALVERTRRLIRRVVEGEIANRLAA